MRIAREGGWGIIHRNLSPEVQAERWRRSKRSQSACSSIPYASLRRRARRRAVHVDLHICGRNHHCGGGVTDWWASDKSRLPLRRCGGLCSPSRSSDRREHRLSPVTFSLEDAKRSCTSTASRNSYSSTSTTSEGPDHGQGHPESARLSYALRSPGTAGRGAAVGGGGILSIVSS